MIWREESLLSAFVICNNEERTIARCIRSLGFADEIVVVDSGSTDQTLAILEKLRGEGFPLTVLSRAWTGFSDQKNFAMDQCKGPWIFSLDADEAATPELQCKVKEIVSHGTDGDTTCYRVRREEFFLGTHLKGGPGCPSFQERLFLKDAVRYDGAIHEYPHLKRGKHGLIQEPILHNPYLDFEGVMRRMNSYTTLEARARFAAGQRTSLLHAFATCFSAFLKNFFVYGGYKSGRVGALWCFTDAISRTFRHLKIWALQYEYLKKAQALDALQAASHDHKAG